MQSMRAKLKLLNFNNKRKEKYSDKWLLKINPLAIAKSIQTKEDNSLSWRAARAIANARIAEVYRDLVLEEEELNLNKETIEGRCEE
jgi:hypothetical protein|tara:strand:- start:170 stop:430 length:261 start_codon:yes stop_codon:yes gene_type:complete